MAAKTALAGFDFEAGTLLLTEQGSKKRASLHAVTGREALLEFDRGGLSVFACDEAEFAAALQATNRTLKRALTDPTILDGIGNAYSDEILHRAGCSPVTRTQSLDAPTCARLLAAARAVLTEWTERLRAQVGDGFPDKVTAFREEMAVHGRFQQPCPVCQSPVQRIRYKSNETNYCANCQTGGKVLADRSLSRLLKDDWPKHIAEQD